MFKIATLTIIFSLSANAKSDKIPDRREFPINSAINPCENFYDYVCSKVIDSFQLREDRSAHTFAFNDSAERILEKKKDYFSQLSKIKPHGDRETALKNYYTSCMNEKVRAQDEQSEIKRMKSLIGEIKTREQLYKWIEKSYLSTDTSPLGWGSTSNLDNPLKNDLYMMASYMSLPEKTYYKKEELMKDFESSITSFFKAIGEQSPETQAKNVIKFESGLAEVTPSPQEFRQLVNDRLFISRKDLQKTFEFLKFDTLLQSIPEEIPIRNWTPDAFKYMSSYFSTAPVEEVRSVLLFHALSDIIDDSNPQYYQVKFDFSKKHLGGSNIRPKRDERCTRDVMGTFGKELDSILMDKMFPNFPKEKFISLAESIRNSILRSLENNSWLSANAKAEAIKKIKLAKLHLISPNTEKEWDFLPKASYDPKHLLMNKKTLSKIYIQKTLKEFKEPNDPGRWDMSPLTVNAYYDGSYNKFVMPIGILQYPFYDPQMSLDENLAAVGTVIGHELGHGIDDQGSRYDSDGKQRLWMEMKDLAEFSKRKEKLVAQFELAKHNGNLTLGENIGDLVGLTASLQQAQTDPEFSKNPERIKNFFVGYARLWCEVKRPKFIENQLKTNPHSLGVARVNEQIKQQVDFKNAYQCKDTDSMVLPKDKLVHIW